MEHTPLLLLDLTQTTVSPTTAVAQVLTSTCLAILGRFVGLFVEVLGAFVHLLGFCLNGLCL